MKAAIFLGLGILGGVLGQWLEYLVPREEDKHFDFRRAALVTLIAGIVTTIYFLFIDPGSVAPGLSGILLVAHYGFFWSLILISGGSPIKTEAPIPESYGRPSGGVTALLQAPMGLILNGFWPVYGVGTFGGFLAELVVLYQDRSRKKKYSLLYWLITGLMIPCSGFVTVLYGINNISALLAFQIGASAPLIVKRFRR